MGEIVGYRATAEKSLETGKSRIFLQPNASKTPQNASTTRRRATWGSTGWGESGPPPPVRDVRFLSCYPQDTRMTRPYGGSDVVAAGNGFSCVAANSRIARQTGGRPLASARLSLALVSTQVGDHELHPPSRGSKTSLRVAGEGPFVVPLEQHCKESSPKLVPRLRAPQGG